MNNNFFPTAFKDKLKNILRYLYGILFLLISIILSLSLFSFNINVSSFLTNSSGQITKFYGDSRIICIKLPLIYIWYHGILICPIFYNLFTQNILKSDTEIFFHQTVNICPESNFGSTNYDSHGSPVFFY